MKSTPVTRLRALTKKLNGPRHPNGETFLVLKKPYEIIHHNGQSIVIEQIGKNSALVDKDGHFYDTFEFIGEEEVCARILELVK